ncbi:MULTISPECIES: fimbria/pilus periplasmic chaperone [Pseudoalteromonas]|uniref:fimbrial biogenesis chaperone n=1 Tax=Pseudoalteromonas TaxID=53246 RepID=UPI0015CD867B|nr:MULTISPECIES: fimbria/pilus periplasmic chaperone [unclassified Pseudoalteromonas]MBB1370316.1 molecular chaperone [Pseudoalteromonas sp. SR45-4]MBH0071457.1 molecular chaperone [Pseudoalteromonas sp. NZS127]NYR12563.1 molecular chaperone [Pseudoalteromonas sp. MIP2626]WMS93658.1 fimbria/pilus periplasmic chaperone [Pseudoalteromonas sp. HL-AS2]|tara:strand:+ start:70008 stop:70706 length:699 start_codon:yes stop_codon:yes gene_type:complete
MRLFIIFILFTASYSALSFQVQPMVAEVQPMGSQSQQTIRIANTSVNPLTIEITAYDLLITDQGDESLRENEDDFLIIPMTTIIPAGKSQSVIVRYIGEPVLSASKAYRLMIDQVKVNLQDDNTSGVGMSLSFRTLLNVVPQGAEAKLMIKSKAQAATGEWKVLLENTGNKYIRLSQAQWVIKGNNEKFVLEGESLSKALSGKLLLPNSSREVTIKIPAQFNAEQSELEVLF